MSRELIKQLKSLKHTEVKPNEEWLIKNRELLLSQIKNTISSKANVKFNFENIWQAMSVFLPYSFVYKVARPIVAVMLIIGMGIGSWAATVSASSEALPGEWLYPAKRAAEKTQVAVADAMGNKNGSTMLHVEFAKRRAIETRTIVSQNDPSKIKIASKTVNDLKEEMKTVNNKLEEIKTTQDSLAEIAQNINQNTQQINDVLKEVKVNLLTNSDTTTSANDLAVQVSEVKNLAKDTAIKAVEVMVEKHLQGDTSVSKDDVKQAISEQLQSAVKETAEAGQNAAEVNKVMAIVKTEVDALASDVKSADFVSGTQALSEKIDATSKQTQAAVSSTQQFTIKTDKTANEGEVLLSQDNLTQAIDKIKEANASTAQSEKITDDALKAAQIVLPAVSAVSPAVSGTPSFGGGSAVISVTTTLASSSLNLIVSVSTTIKINASTTPVILVSSTTNPISTTKK